MFSLGPYSTLIFTETLQYKFNYLGMAAPHSCKVSFFKVAREILIDFKFIRLLEITL